MQATTPAQLRSLCNAAVRVLEPEEMAPATPGSDPPLTGFQTYGPYVSLS